MVNNEEMYGLLMNMVEQQAVPDIELECFDGYPLELFGHIQKSNGEMDSRTSNRLLGFMKYTKEKNRWFDQALCL